MSSEMFLNLCLGTSTREEFIQLASMLDYDVTGGDFWRAAVGNWILADREDMIRSGDIESDMLVHIINCRSKRIIETHISNVQVDIVPTLFEQTKPSNQDILVYMLYQVRSKLYDIVFQLIEQGNAFDVVSFILDKLGLLLDVNELQALEAKMESTCSISPGVKHVLAVGE